MVLDALAGADLDTPSELPGWSRLTIACHLRYGAAAVLRMTHDVLAGREAAYYPAGRAVQRPATLAPVAGESAADVLASWRDVAAELDGLWAGLAEAQWALPIVEPADNPDVGAEPLGWLPLSRLTEVEVHGTDLGMGLPDWSDVFVSVALPARLRLLHRRYGGEVAGRWLLRPDEGRPWLVEAADGTVAVRPASAGTAAAGDVVVGAAVGADATTASAGADAVGVSEIAGSARDIVALLLGRPTLAPLRLGGDADLAAGFGAAFPGFP